MPIIILEVPNEAAVEKLRNTPGYFVIGIIQMETPDGRWPSQAKEANNSSFTSPDADEPGSSGGA